MNKKIKKHAGISKAHDKRAGISLVEILVSLSIFSIGIIGLYLSVQGMNKSMQTSMQRDVEAAYANMLISEVNMFDLNLETVYDTSGSTKQSITLPDGRTVWYLRRVDSDTTDSGTDGTPIRADVKYVHIYLYRNQADAVNAPYRHFKREIPLLEQNFAMKISADICKDATGRVFTPIRTTAGPAAYSLTVGSIRAGLDTTTMGGSATHNWQSANSGNVNGSIDSTVSGNCNKHQQWRSSHERNPLIYKIPVSEGKSYEVTLGFNEYDTVNVTAPTHRAMDVSINGTQVDNAVDPYGSVGYYTAFTRTYTTKGAVDTNGIYTITVRLDRDGAATRDPRLSWLSVKQSGVN